ncbi:MAG: ATP-binding protein [Steroidobacteraceae bacterium]
MRLFPRGVLGRVLVVVALTAIVGLIAGLLLYQGSSRFSVREEEAYRTSEHVVIASRLLDGEAPVRRPRLVAAVSTEHFEATWGDPPLENDPDSEVLDEMRRHMFDWEPSLASRDIRLQLGDDTEVIGSVQLADGSWMRFVARDLIGSCPAEMRPVAIATVPMILLVLVAVFALRAILHPLELLANAVSSARHDTATLLPEQGIPELRRLIRVYNDMQSRIFAMMKTRTEALAAVGHDLRTPLSRLRLRVDDVEEESVRDALISDMNEMELMLDSLLTYFRGDDHPEQRRLVDLAVMIATVVDDLQDRGFDIHYAGPDHCDAWLRPVEFKRALSNLANNACQYGNSSEVRLVLEKDAMLIQVLDDGPGIPEEHMEAVLEPFMRLDPARQRNTSGVGLGIPIAVRVIRDAGGALSLSNRPEGGLCAQISLPRTSVLADAPGNTL